MTLKACVCMCEYDRGVCVTLFGCAFLILQPSIGQCVHVYAISTTMCKPAYVCLFAPACVCVCGGDTDNMCVGIYDTFYLFTIVPPVFAASPRGNQASLIAIISDMSQTVCLTGE